MVKKKLNKKDKEILWVLIIAGIILISFLAGYFYVESLKRFEFGGVNFEKIKDGSLVFYHGRFPIIYLGVPQNYYNLYLRNDPRENNILINIDKFKFDKKVIISTEPGVEVCGGDGVIAIANLAMFLSAFPFIEDVEGAVSYEETAKELNLSFANCSSAINQTVILVQKSETPSITQDKQNKACYKINIGDCENIISRPFKAINRWRVG